ncbi:MAG: FadR family transcriptional regulator [Halieaceae bacterium]|nr:FadR family transcriptional regulator [Halieaceae bacterium]
MSTNFPDITPLEREQRLYERVADKILLLIQDEVWQPGDKIPPERELAQGFGVSRTVVREAVKVLEAQGVLESATGSGVYVRAADSSVVSKSIHTYLQLLSQDDVEIRVAEIRRVLEVEIAALAALRATPEQRRELQAICAEMRRYANSARTLAELDFRLHLTLARSTQNDLFELLLTPLMEQLHDYYLYVWDSYGERPPDKVFAQHEVLVQAVMAGDAAAARQAMSDHVAYSSEVLDNRLKLLNKDANDES